jgi:hypothetical protein
MLALAAKLMVVACNGPAAPINVVALVVDIIVVVVPAPMLVLGVSTPAVQPQEHIITETSAKVMLEVQHHC